MPIDEWVRCTELARPGIVFELRNDQGQSLFTPCVQPAPTPPFDWQVPPTEFRAVPEPQPSRSDPLPKPAG